MPFISNGIYDADDSGDGIFSKPINANVEFMDIDTTFFNEVLINYNVIINHMSSWSATVFNPFFVHNNILYCAGYFGNPKESSDYTLYWHKYDLVNKTYSTQSIAGLRYTWTSNDRYMIVPIRHISDLKFYCMIMNDYIYNDKTIPVEPVIMDYNANTLTSVSDDSLYFGGNNLKWIYVSKSGKAYMRSTGSEYCYIFDTMGSSIATTSSSISCHIPVFSRISSSGSDEIISIDHYENSNTSTCNNVFYVTDCASPYSNKITSAAMSSTNSETSGSDTYRWKYWNATAIELNYENIHCVWVQGAYPYPGQLIVTGNTDTTNSIQPHRIIMDVSGIEYIDQTSLTLRKYIIRNNTINQYQTTADLRVPYIPDLDKHVMYGLPDITYSTSSTTSIMMRVTVPFLDELDAKGGSVW